MKKSSATVWNGCMTSPAVWGPSANSTRLEVQLHWRLLRRSWCASDWVPHLVCISTTVLVELNSLRRSNTTRRGEGGGGKGSAANQVIPQSEVGLCFIPVLISFKPNFSFGEILSYSHFILMLMSLVFRYTVSHAALTFILRYALYKC